MLEYTVSIVNWSDREPEIVMVRGAVFVEEQNVPADIEIDGTDQYCRHVLACDDGGNPIGTGRIDDKGKIGRWSVVFYWAAAGTPHRTVLVKFWSQTKIVAILLVVTEPFYIVGISQYRFCPTRNLRIELTSGPRVR